MATHEEPVPEKAGRREWLGLIVLALPCLLYAMDLTVLNLALPRLSQALRPTSTQLLWIVDIYGFLVAGMLVPMGMLGDRLGRRRVLLVGAAAFGIASVGAAFCTSAPMLIAARALLGVAGATLAPSTLSLIRNMFLDHRQRTIAIGVWTTSFSVGAALGPLLGGILLEHFWWGSVFLLGVPVMGALLILGPLLLPEHREPNTGKPDLASAALSLCAVLLAIYGMKAWANDGFGGLPFATIALGLFLFVVFVRRQRRLAEPLLDLRLFRVPEFCVSLATLTLTSLVVFGFYVFSAQYLQLVLGLSPLSAGIWMLPGSCSVILSSVLAPAVVRRVQPAYVISGALALCALGFSVLTQIAHTGLWGLVCGWSIVYLGLGPVYTLGTDLIIGAAPPERAGAAAALSETGSELGGALGIAALGSFGTASYRSLMDVVDLGGVSPAVRSAARETLGAATAVAQELGMPASQRLLSAARAAFVVAMTHTAIICALLSVAIALLAVLVLRGQRPSQGAQLLSAPEAAQANPSVSTTGLMSDPSPPREPLAFAD
ncbi:MAG: MFS transporter [Polyangiaceae bacterium]